MGRKSTNLRGKLDEHFTFIPGQDCYKCLICPKVMKGMKKTNFLQSAKDHLQRIHAETWKGLTEEESIVPEKQMRLAVDGQMVSSQFKDRELFIRSLAKTTLSINLFRSPRNRSVLEALIKLPSVPNYKTIMKDLEKLAEQKLARLKMVDFFGLQLDHWSNIRRQNCLLISLSTITEQWKQLLQVIEFSVVPNTKSDVTVTEIHAVLDSYNLKVNQCVSIQADNCSAMVATARKFKHLVTDGEPSDSESEDDITVFEVEGQFSTETNEPLREFAGCGAHRLNNSIWDSVNRMKFFEQLNDFSLKHKGPKLANTRWYGHLVQLEFAQKHMGELNEDRVSSNNRSFSHLDPLAVKQMYQVMIKIRGIG